VGHAIDLLAHGRVEPWMPVPVNVAPQAGHGIKVLSPLDIDDRAALRTLENQRLVFGHLRERMPDDLAIPALELIM
jgi:hypothetical protein